MKKTFKHTTYFSKQMLAVFFCMAALCLNAQWLQVEGLPGGRILDVKKAQYTVFATGQDSSWRSTDGGANWERIAELPERTTVVTDGPNVLASTSGSVWPSNLRLFQSADDGFTWNELMLESADSLGPAFQVFGIYVYAQKIFGSGTYRTNDFGATWKFVSNEEFAFIPDGGKMYRSNGYAFLESSDGGFFWDTLSVLPNKVNLELKKGDEILLSSWTTPNDNILYFSKDNGGTWMTMPIPTGGNQPYNIFTLHQGKLYAFDNFSTSALVADLSVGVFETLLLPEGSQTSKGVISTGEKLLRSTYSSGVSLSNDGTSWSKVQGITTGGIFKVFDGDLYATSGTGFYRLKPDKQHWEQIAPDFELRQIRGFAVQGNCVTFASFAGKIWVSNDGGQTFESGKNEDGSIAYGIYRMEESGGQLFGWDYGGLRIFQPRYSDDCGLSWKSLSASIGSLYPTTLAVSNGHLYLCDTLNLLYRWNASGQSFEQISTTPIPFAGSKQPKFTIFVKDDTYIVAEPADSYPQNMIEARYFVSTDAGQSWTEHLLGLASIECSGDTIFATGLGLQVGISTDQADTWQLFSEGLEGNAAWLKIFEGEVFASTANRIYRRKTNGELPTIPVAEPVDFSGFRISPNPFSEHFAVQISKSKPATTARLYDLLGRPIALPERNASNAEILFSGMGHLPRGVYFLEIECGGSRSVERMMKI